MPLPTELTTPPVTKIYFGIQKNYTPKHPEKLLIFLRAYYQGFRLGFNNKKHLIYAGMLFVLFIVEKTLSVKFRRGRSVSFIL